MKHLKILAVSLVCVLSEAQAQNPQEKDAPKEKVQKGVAIVTQDPNESPVAAKQRGVEDAQIDAIERAFPYLIEDETTTTIKDGNVDYVMKSNKKVRGIWIKHDREATCETRTVTSRGEQVNQYTCTVYGLIREVKNEPLQFLASPLSSPYKDEKKEVFESGEPFYVHFQSAVDGYISIFFRSASSVSRIMPYPRLNTPKYNKGMKVQGGVNYIFYDPKHSSIEELKILPEFVLPLQLYTDFTQGEESNTMYVLFSEEKIPRPPMNNAYDEANFTYPPEMDAYDFERWLEDRRLSDLSLQELSYKITVRAPR